MSKWTERLTDILDVVTTTLVNGVVRANIGNAATNAGADANVPIYGIDGFVSRPADADENGAARLLFIRDGNQKIGIAAADRRYAMKVGDLQPGDKAIVSIGVARWFLKNARDAITAYTEKRSNGHSMLISVDGQSGKITLAVGLTKLEITEDGIFASVNGGPALTLDGTTKSASIRADSLNLDGGFVTVGLLPGGIRPTIIGAQSVLYGVQGQIGAPSQTVLVAI